jgi:hypothetical protein
MARVFLPIPEGDKIIWRLISEIILRFFSSVYAITSTPAYM